MFVYEGVVVSSGRLLGDKESRPAATPCTATRPMPFKRHFEGLDGLRGLAILSVFFLHYGGGGRSSNPVIAAIGFFCSLGGVGVTLFFCLSGFLISGLLWDSKGQTRWFRNFYIRRALRIMPLYYGTLLVLLAWPAFVARYHFKDIFNVVWIHALYLQNVPRYSELWKRAAIPYSMEHYWSLAVEEQFYLLWPFLLLLVKTIRQAAMLCLGIFLGSFAFRVLNEQLAHNPAALQHSLPSHAGSLVLGGAVAFAYRSGHWQTSKRILGITGLLSAALFFGERLLHWRRGDASYLESTIDLVLVALACAGMIAYAIEPGLLQRLMSIRWLRWLGVVSYGVYIFHWLPAFGYEYIVRTASGHAGDTVYYGLRLVLAAVVTLCLARLSLQFYEKPFLRLKDRWAPQTPR